MFTIFCANCYMPFAVPDDFDNAMRKCHNTFYCPRGHHNFYPGKSDEEKLRAQLWEKEQSIQKLRRDVVRLEQEKAALVKKPRKPRKKKMIKEGLVKE